MNFFNKKGSTKKINGYKKMNFEIYFNICKANINNKYPIF